MDVWDHFAQRERECEQFSLIPDGDFSSMCAEMEGSDGRRGMWWGQFALGEHAILDAHEVLQADAHGHIHRERYSYYLIIDGAEVWGFDRDPDHDPPTHRHVGVGHKRYPCRRMIFGDVVKQAWDTVSHEEYLEDAPADFAPLEEQ